MPTGIPLVYRLDKNPKPILSDRACEPLNGYFLVDPEELKKAQEKVANQSKLRYGEEKPAERPRVHAHRAWSVVLYYVSLLPLVRRRCDRPSKALFRLARIRS